MFNSNPKIQPQNLGTDQQFYVSSHNNLIKNQAETTKLLNLNSTAVINPGEYKRSGEYLQTGVKGVGLYDNLENVSEDYLQERINELISMNKV